MTHEIVKKCIKFRVFKMFVYAGCFKDRHVFFVITIDMVYPHFNDQSFFIGGDKVFIFMCPSDIPIKSPKNSLLPLLQFNIQTHPIKHKPQINLTSNKYTNKTNQPYTNNLKINNTNPNTNTNNNTKITKHNHDTYYNPPYYKHYNYTNKKPSYCILS